FTSQAEARRGDAFHMLASHPDRMFDYIYVAPPQYLGLWSKAILSLDANPGWLSDGAWVIAQIDPREYQRLCPDRLQEFDERKYGNTLLVFYENSSRR
ncbi:MAG: 16S rRNA (guanine(966)-N(2))-methyltransferase RsmD, partial [Chloroflexi bacterium]|nr:16S rRNA (guanine(966)-N(2))-methyltransferase RsmD [Chloroflexota bacterium]